MTTPRNPTFVVAILLLPWLPWAGRAVAQTITQIIDYTGDGTNLLNNSYGIAVDPALTGQLSRNALVITPGGGYHAEPRGLIV